MFLHEHGYNFFNVSKLTYPEINALISAKNRRTKEEEIQMKKAQQKAKMKKARRGRR